MLAEESVKIVRDGRISEVLVDRPASLNALNADVLQGMILALGKLTLQPDLRVIIIGGSGEKSFVAGADISSMSQLGPRAIADYVELGQRCMREIENAPVPVIARVNGYALGGGLELALACDLILASKKARLGQPEVNLGIIPGFGGTQRLMQRVGIGAARRLIYSAELIHAEEALALGLVDKVFEHEQLFEETNKFAELIASKAPLAVRSAKKLIGVAERPLLLGGLRSEIEGFLELFQSRDRDEGMRAFLEKREPKFENK